MNHVDHTVRFRRDASAVVETMRVAPVSVAPAAITARLPARKTCLNCETILVGEFCHHCGQAAKAPARITLGAILHELPHAILHLEHALPRTIFALVRRPGHTIREYLAGKRVHTYSPFTLLFLVSGLLGLAMLTLEMNRISAGIGTQQNDLAQKIATIGFKYQGWMRLGLLPLLAIGPTVALRGRTGFRYGEQIVAAAMLTAGTAVLKLLWFPFEYVAIRAHVSFAAQITSVAELSTTFYALWTYAQLQDDGTRKDGARRWLRSVGALALDVVVLAVVFVAVCVVIHFAITWKKH
jgi:hypothetical protein